MEDTLTDKPHSKGFVHVEMINAEQLDVFFRFRKDTPFNSDTLRCNFVVCREASDPIDEVGDTQRKKDSKPLPKVIDDRWVAGEQDFFGLGLLRDLNKRPNRYCRTGI